MIFVSFLKGFWSTVCCIFENCEIVKISASLQREHALWISRRAPWQNWNSKRRKSASENALKIPAIIKIEKKCQVLVRRDHLPGEGVFLLRKINVQLRFIAWSCASRHPPRPLGPKACRSQDVSHKSLVDKSASKLSPSPTPPRRSGSGIHLLLEIP